jgi:hypothetical protein
MVRTVVPVLTSQKLILGERCSIEKLADASNLPWGLNATEDTLIVSTSSRIRTSVPVAASHSEMYWEEPAAASILSTGLKATEATSAPKSRVWIGVTPPSCALTGVGPVVGKAKKTKATANPKSFNVLTRMVDLLKVGS